MNANYPPTRPRAPRGAWSSVAPPYLHGISDRDFARLKEEWLYVAMRATALVHSHRVVAYFVADHLNWATMDCWVSHETLARLVGGSEKTIQRAIARFEELKLISVWRLRGSRMPLRYAPVYQKSPEKMKRRDVRKDGQSCPPKVDTRVHQSFLSILPESSLSARQEGARGTGGLPFNRHERGRFEQHVSAVLGDDEALHRLAQIDDSIVTRLCTAYALDEFGDRQIKATRLAAKQWRLG